jgi:hypothetical protein
MYEGSTLEWVVLRLNGDKVFTETLLLLGVLLLWRFTGTCVEAATTTQCSPLQAASL